MATFLRAPLRRLPLSSRSIAPRAVAACFHSTPRRQVSVGDDVPSLEVLHENSPSNKVDLAREFADAGKGLIIGVPAAFSGTCSQRHIPGYINHPKVQEMIRAGGRVAVVSVNDAFVMKAWHDQLDPARESGIRFFADPSAAFTKALDLDFDGTAIFGGPRSKRYALVIEDGRITEANVEPDNTGTAVSMAEQVLG